MSTRFINADVIDGLRQIADESVHCVVTSPPYWGLRKYEGVDPSVWGGSATCDHKWGERERGRRGDILPLGESESGRLGTTEAQTGLNDGGKFCDLCGAWLGCLGLEPKPDMFVQHIVEVFREVGRVLHPSGTVWLNFGDCYICAPHGDGHSFDPKYGGRNRKEGYTANRLGGEGTSLKSKDLVMIPARVAIALQEDGWYLRSQIPWIKRNGMPESSSDRPSSGVEYIFLLAKSETYFYDRVGVLEPQAEHERTRRLREQKQGLATTYSLRRDAESHGQVKAGKGSCTTTVMARQALAETGMRARRNTDWAFESFRGLVTDECGDPLAMMVNPQPFTLERCITCGTIYTKKEHRKLKKSGDTRACRCGGTEWLSHFATFPEAMVEPCVIAGTSDAGACHYCGAQMQRVVAEKFIPQPDVSAAAGVRPATRDRTTPARRGWEGVPRGSLGGFTKGWEPSCSHPLFPPDPVPSVVLDPFGGSGTVAVVAARHFCDAILIDRSAAYLEMAKFRLDNSNA